MSKGEFLRTGKVNPILVCGAPRSGTTWIGPMLRTLLRPRQGEDFALERIVNVHRYILSKTEARLCALEKLWASGKAPWKIWK